MATCDLLAANAAAAAKIIKDYTAIANNALAAGFSGTAEQVNERRNTVISARQIIDSNLARLRQLKSEQEQNGCVVTGYSPEIQAANAVYPKLAPFISTAEQKVTELITKEEQQAAATQQANRALNNSGTGAPGTAGQGKDSTVNLPTNNALKSTPKDTDLQEVQVTGKRVPTIGADGLEEVTVTGRRAPEELQEVQVTGKRIPEQLEEVTVTGRRNPDELEEVTVTGKRVNTNQGAVEEVRIQATLRDEVNFDAKKDWRVRLSLSPGATYLYRDDSNKLLAPLKATDGIIFPYTPSIQVAYASNYGASRPAHSNYYFYQYENSGIDQISITCDFTAQDTQEARYLLAVIHFLRSATKMFYGKDQNPKPGTPPPLCYLFGLGEFQFNAHPLAITYFNYSLPNNVDYIRVGETDAFGTSNPNSSFQNQDPGRDKKEKSFKFNWGTIAQNFIQNRLASGAASIGNAIGLKLSPGGQLSNPDWMYSGFNPVQVAATSSPTYVPTQIQIQIAAVPMQSRFDVSQNFSLKDYANGTLLKGVTNKAAGFW